MGIVLLIGFSTAGKSTLCRRFAELNPNLKVIDTDIQVTAEQPFNGDMHKMYSYFHTAGDVTAPNLYLELGERHFLQNMRNNPSPCLIAAGPNVPLRDPQWSAFVEAVRPTCFYFRLSAQELYEGLKSRRERQVRRRMDELPGFGSWENELTMRYDSATGTWQELPEEEALERLNAHITKTDPIYSQFCAKHRIYSGINVKFDKKLQGDLLETFRHYVEAENMTFSMPSVQAIPAFT